MIEGFEVGGRLGRGRAYARQGQVVALEIEAGSVRAEVQGSRVRPYVVRIKLAAFPDSDWRKVTAELAEQAHYAAKLLSGEMPEDIEEAFQKVGLSLFPRARGDLRTECTCPDQSNPCKHVAAVYYLLGDEFDRDPFLVFKLRGMERARLLEALGAQNAALAGGQRRREPPRPGSAPGAQLERAVEGRSQQEPEPEAPPEARSEPLCADAAGFWGGDDVPDETLGEVRIPVVAAALPKRLGAFPFWRGEEGYIESMERVYRAASPLGMEVFLSHEADDRE